MAKKAKNGESFGIGLFQESINKFIKQKSFDFFEYTKNVITMKKYSLYIITIPLAIAFAILILWLSPKNNNKQQAAGEDPNRDSINETANIENSQNNDFGFKCPSDFKTPEEYKNSVTSWINEYTNKYPEVTAEKIMHVRDKLVEENKCGKQPLAIDDSANVDVATELANAIKQAESERPPIIGESPSDEEIYNNPHVKHIRIALDSYLAGTNEGIETYNFLFNGGALDESVSGSSWCGLKHFDKSYYKSKFIIYAGEVSSYEFGGLQAYLVFVDNPDTLFWTVVYQYAGGDYVLRRFCGIDPVKFTEHGDNWPIEIQKLIRESRFSF